MNKKNFLFGILAIVFLFFVFTFIIARTIPAHTHHHHHHHHRPRPRPRPMFIGGCKGTRYGCCPGSRKACNEDCSNC